MTPTALQPRIPDALPVEVEPPRVYTVPPRATEPAGEEGSGIAPLAYLRYRWATVLFLGGTVAAILGFVAHSVIPAKYTTYSIIRVSPQDPKLYFNEDPQGRGDSASYLNTQAQLLRSHFVLTAAIRDPQVAALPMLRSQPDPVRFLEEELVVEKSDGSELLKPKLSGDDPQAITMIVNAIHRAYFDEVVEKDLTRKKERLKAIDKEISRMQKDLEKKTPAPADKGPDQPAESLPGVGPSLAASQLTRLRDKLDTAEVRLKQLHEEKKRVARRRENPAGELPPLPPGFVAQLENDPAIAGINKQVGQMQAKLTYMLKLNPDETNPGARDLKQKISEAAQEKDRLRKERVEEFQRTQLAEVGRTLQRDDERIDADLIAVKIVEERVREEIKTYEAKLAKILPDVGEGPKDFGQVDSRSQTEIVSGMMNRKNLLELEISAPRRVVDVQPAAVPMKRESKKQLMGTAAAFLIGFALVGLGVVGYEARVRRAMTVADVQKATLGPILGAIPQVRTATGEPTADLALAEEAIEKTRSNLMQQFGKPGGKVVVLTSALGDEGRTFLARELALSFARSGGRTLLADFDLRAPVLHEMFEVPNDAGFCQLLSGEADLPSAARVLPYGIAFLPAGPWNDVTRQYLSAARIAAVVAELRDQFDYVIVNAHPVLSVAETALVGRTADAVVLTTEKYESRLPLVTRAQEKLAALAPEAFGVVVLGASRDECLQ
jgi:polysaccharide biosynthesis transport protein